MGNDIIARGIAKMVQAANANLSEYKTSRLNLDALGLTPNQDNTSVFPSILQSQGDGILYLPKGIYYLDELTISDVDNLTIYFDGEIRPFTKTDSAVLKFINCKNLKLYDLKINAEFKVYRPLRFWKCSDLYLHKPVVTNVGKEDYVDNLVRDEEIEMSASIGIEIKAECHNTTIYEPRIENVYNDYFSSGIQLNATTLDGTPLDLTKTSKHIRITRPYIKNVYPRADGDGIFAAGVNKEDTDGIVEGGIFINCRKRAMKFQQAGWRSVNNNMTFYQNCYAPLDFQGGDGKSINDKVIFDGIDNVGFAVSLVEAKRGNIVIDGLKQEFINGNYSSLVDMTDGEGSTTALCRIYDYSVYEPGTNCGNITIKNCNIDLVSCLTFVDTTNGTDGIKNITIDNNKVNLYRNMIFRNLSGGKFYDLKYLNNEVNYLGSSGVFYLKTNVTHLYNSNIELLNVPDSFEPYNLHLYAINSNIKCRVATTPFNSRNFDFTKNKYTFYCHDNPANFTFSNSNMFNYSKTGDVAINIASNFINEGSFIEKWVCVADADTTNPKGLWKAISHSTT